MDATGPTQPDPGREPGDAPNPFAGAEAAPPAAPPAARAGRPSAAEWLWSRRIPVRTTARTRRGKVTVGLLALALAAGGGVAIAATTDTATPSPTASPEGNVKIEKGDAPLKLRGPMGLKLGMLGHGGMVHGEFTVPDGDGGYRTMITQNGTVANVDGDKLTVKSADGWSKDYTLDTSTLVGGQRYWSADTAGGLTQGQEVSVVATVKDGTAHADHVRTRLDKADLEKRATEMKQRMGEKMEMFGEKGARVFKFRGGPDEHMKMPGMPGMEGELRVRPAPEGDVTVPAPDVEPGMFTAPAEEDFTVLAG